MSVGPFIDLGNPISAHPLNKSLVGWWLPLPNNSGGSRLFDLTGKRNHGTLTAGPIWGTGGTNHFKALVYDGVDDRVEVPTNTAYSGMAKITVAAFIKPTNLVSTPEIVKKNSVFLLRTNGTSLQVAVWTSGLNIIAGGTMTNGVWVHTAMTYDGVTLRGWLNGISVCNTPVTGSVAVSAAENLCIGNQPGGGENFTGTIQDAAVYADYVDPMALYDQARRGYPDLLNRWSRRFWTMSPPAAAAGGGRNLLGEGTLVGAGPLMGQGVLVC